MFFKYHIIITHYVRSFSGQIQGFRVFVAVIFLLSGFFRETMVIELFISQPEATGFEKLKFFQLAFRSNRSDAFLCIDWNAVFFLGVFLFEARGLLNLHLCFPCLVLNL